MEESDEDQDNKSWERHASQDLSHRQMVTEGFQALASDLPLRCTATSGSVSLTCFRCGGGHHARGCMAVCNDPVQKCASKIHAAAKVEGLCTSCRKTLTCKDCGYYCKPGSGRQRCNHGVYGGSLVQCFECYHRAPYIQHSPWDSIRHGAGRGAERNHDGTWRCNACALRAEASF